MAKCRWVGEKGNFEACSTQFVDIEAVLPRSYHMLPPGRSHLTQAAVGLDRERPFYQVSCANGFPGCNGQTINGLTSNSKKAAARVKHDKHEAR